MRWWPLLLTGLVLSTGCVRTWTARFAVPEGQIPADGARFLKVHALDGGVYVFDEWTRAEDGGVVGQGLWLDKNRNQRLEGRFEVRRADVALFETNDRMLVMDAGVPVMLVATGVSVLVTATCLTNPKACFGSCPTFYAQTGDGLGLQAEGFSESILPSLEVRDVDALYTAVSPEDGHLTLVLTNEAMESHYLRQVQVLAAPRPAGGRVLRQGERFVATGPIQPPQACTVRGQDCLEPVLAVDDESWLSPTDPDDLGTLEHIELELPGVQGDAGLLIAGRQGLVTTYVFYQVLAWMGSTAGSWWTRLGVDPEGTRQRFDAPGRLLGDLEVELWHHDAWRPVGRFEEVGPIAREVQMVALPADREPGPVRVRLTGAQGNWRLDQVGIASLVGDVEPVVVEVESARGPDGDAPDVAERLRDADRYQVNLPGDRYELDFTLPDGQHELFLASQGHYIEWMREGWLAEEDSVALARFLRDPRAALRRMAPGYKALEPEAERIFWDSRVDLGVVPEGGTP